jgi:hypothetical protein
LGHLKHGDDAMDDGQYQMEISGIDHVNHTNVDTVMGPVGLADGSMMSTEVRKGSITIDAIPGQGSNEWLHLQTDDNNGRLRMNVGFDTDNQMKLGDLDNLNFDYYINSSDRTDVIPVIRVTVDTDGNLATTTDRAELVFEYAYQGLGPTTQDVVQHVDLIGADWNVWQRANGANHDNVADLRHFSDYIDSNGAGGDIAGGVHIDANDVVLGFSVALGSGNGTNDMYLDNLHVGGVTYDFLA